MPFYIVDTSNNKKRSSEVVNTLSYMIRDINGIWEISANEILKKLGESSESKLILIQREGNSNEIEFEVEKFIGYTHQQENSWWAPLVIQGFDEKKQLVHCFVYIVSEHPNFFANSQSYGPNIWPEALLTICRRALADVELEILRRI